MSSSIGDLPRRKGSTYRFIPELPDLAGEECVCPELRGDVCRCARVKVGSSVQASEATTAAVSGLPAVDRRDNCENQTEADN